MDSHLRIGNGLSVLDIFEEACKWAPVSTLLLYVIHFSLLPGTGINGG